MTTAPGKDAAPDAYRSAPYRWYALVIFWLIFTCHSIDRGMPNILVEPIRHEFHLSDSQMGLFAGLGYAVAFSVAILPMGLISDRTNRRNFLAIILFIWSICTALCGLGRNFVQLLAARIGVGGADSGALPVVLPMVSDIVPPKNRGSVLGLLYTGNAVGVFAATFLGGIIAANYGWRAAFFVAGIPGLILTVLLLTTIREPRRGGAEPDAAQQTGPAEKPPTLRETFAFMGANPGLITLLIACGLMGLVSITMSAWMGSFFIRVHHLGLKQTGAILGTVSGLGMLLSPLLLGWMGDKLGARSERGPLLVVSAGIVLSLTSGLILLFTPSLPVAIACLFLGDLFRIGYSPPCYTVYVNNTPVRFRGVTMSLMQLGTNLLGYGLGPLLVGALSDLYGGEGMLRYAMANAMAILLIAIALLLASNWLLFGRKAKLGGAAAVINRSPTPSQ